MPAETPRRRNSGLDSQSESRAEGEEVILERLQTGLFYNTRLAYAGLPPCAHAW
jgi:hypothetical protein